MNETGKINNTGSKAYFIFLEISSTKNKFKIKKRNSAKNKFIF